MILEVFSRQKWENNKNKNSQIQILGFHCVAKFSNRKVIRRVFFFVFLVYSQIWLNLPTEDRHFGYKWKFLKIPPMRGIYIFNFFSLYFWRLSFRSFFFASFPFQALPCNVCAEARPLHHTRKHSEERARERERSRAEEIAKEFERGFDWRNGWRRWRLGRTPEGGTQGRRRSGCQALVLQQAWRHACPWRLQTLIAFFFPFFLPPSVAPRFYLTTSCICLHI